MKIKQNFESIRIADDYYLIPVGDEMDTFNGTVALNEVSAFLIQNMKKDISEEELVKRVIEEYDVDVGTAQSDVHDALDAMKRIGIIHE